MPFMKAKAKGKHTEASEKFKDLPETSLFYEDFEPLQHERLLCFCTRCDKT